MTIFCTKSDIGKAYKVSAKWTGWVVGVATELTDQLVVVELRSTVVHGEPPGSRADRRRADIAADGHVAEEEPVADERLPGAAWWLVHDLQVGRVEAESRGRQSVRHQVHPQQLDWDEGLGHAERSRQEDAHHLHPPITVHHTLVDL